MTPTRQRDNAIIHLSKALYWRSSLQGHYFWCQVRKELNSLTDKDLRDDFECLPDVDEWTRERREAYIMCFIEEVVTAERPVLEHAYRALAHRMEERSLRAGHIAIMKEALQRAREIGHPKAQIIIDRELDYIMGLKHDSASPAMTLPWDANWAPEAKRQRIADVMRRSINYERAFTPYGDIASCIGELTAKQQHGIDTHVHVTGDDRSNLLHFVASLVWGVEPDDVRDFMFFAEFTANRADRYTISTLDESDWLKLASRALTNYIDACEDMPTDSPESARALINNHLKFYD